MIGTDENPVFVRVMNGVGGGAPKERLPIFNDMYNKEKWLKSNEAQNRSKRNNHTNRN